MHAPLRLAAFAPVVFAATLVACGSSTSTATSATASARVPSTATPIAAQTATPIAAPTATPTAALAGLACPDAGTVNAGLGLTVAALASQPAADLPAGSTGIVCTYSDTANPQSVVVDLATGPVLTSFINLVEAGEKQAAQAQGNKFSATDVSGVGSQAVLVTVAGSPAENGIIAVSGTTGLTITGLPPLSQSQLQSFASQLLG